MNTKPILFSTPMVQAILNGTKVQTRRVIKPQPYNLCADKPEMLKFYHLKDNVFRVEDFAGRRANNEIKCPYGKVGDVLWVRETIVSDSEYGWMYKATKEGSLGNASGIEMVNFLNEKDFDNGRNYIPSIHMPKEACRLFLKIKEVKVERLQDISRGDAMDEGCPFSNMAAGPNPKDWFAQLWQSINGEKSWNENLWVWVIEFERIEKPEGF